MELNTGRWVLDISWLLLLFILLVHFIRNRRSLLNAQSWLKVKGHVTYFEWVEADHSIWPKIEYSYQVQEQDLVGEYFFLDTSLNNPHSKYARLIAYKAALAYKEGALIDIYYNPNKPEQSALDVTVPLKLNIILLLISSLILIQLVIIAAHLFV